MPNTPMTGTPYPASTDAPDGPAQIQAAAVNLEKFAIPRFASTAARDVAIPSPTEGQYCYLTGGGTAHVAQRYAWGQWNFVSDVLYGITGVTSPFQGQLGIDITKARLVVQAGGAWIPMATWSAGGRSGFAISRAAAQSIPNGGALNAFVWDTETFDSDGWGAPGSALYTAPLAVGSQGLYAASIAITPATIAWGTNAADRGQLLKNGSAVLNVPLNIGYPTAGLTHYAFGFVDLLPSDTIGLSVIQNSGGATNFTATLSLYRITV